VPDVARWIAALTTLVGFGLMMGFNPALYGATADMLARNTRVAARMTWMLLGLAAGATTLYLVLQSFDPTGLVTTVEQRADAAVLSRRVDVIAGAVFLVGAAAVAWWRLRVPERSTREKPAKAAARSWNYFLLGLGSSVIGFTTLPIMYMTGRVAAGVTDDPLLRLLAYGVFLVALAGPFVALAGAWSRFPVAAARLTRYYTHAIGLDYRWLYAGVLAGAGVACIAYGFFGPR
jgi:cytochrome c biogenesis protein CcdA